MADRNEGIAVGKRMMKVERATAVQASSSDMEYGAKKGSVAMVERP
jgi:hypothetical protein